MNYFKHFFIWLWDSTADTKSSEKPNQIEKTLGELTLLFKGMVESYPDTLIVVDRDGKIELINKRVEKTFGYMQSELLGQPIECLVPDRLRSTHLRNRVGYQHDSYTRPMGVGLEIYGRRKDGSEFPLDIMLSPIQLESRRLTLAVVRDISEHKAIQKALLEEKEWSHLTLNSIGEGVLGIDNSGKIIYLNKVAEEMTGWSLSEASGRPFAAVFHIVDADTQESVQNPLQKCALKGYVGLPMNSMLIRRDGAEVPIEDSIAPIRDARGKITGSVVIFRDVTKTHEMTQQLVRLAQHDCLTNLPNRTLLNDRLTQAISLAGRHSALFALLFLDLDHFKHINDSLGHGIGDALLQSVAERLKSCIRSSDTVSRQGGDEFVILLSEINNTDDIILVAEKMLKVLSAPITIGKHELYTSASIGISIYPDDGQDGGTLIKHADVAMYYAKDSGRSNYQFFTQDMNIKSIKRQSIESGLRQALEKNNFVLYYQPKVNLNTHTIVGAEALIRWQHPQQGLISPGEFISIAEDSGLILPIGQWVLQQTCKQLRDWQDEGLEPITVSINVSALEFRNNKFIENVRSTLKDSRVKPCHLEIELTESVLMQNVESTIFVLEELKSMGVMLTIDDFGTGYSSLSYLSRFPLDVVKIDQSFVHEITTHTDDVTIVSAVIGMCHGLKCKVIAEGVETLEQARLLQSRHCSEAQGFYFGRPMVAAEFTSLLKKMGGGGGRNKPVKIGIKHLSSKYSASKNHKKLTGSVVANPMLLYLWDPRT